MATEQNKALVERYFQALSSNAHPQDFIDEFIDDQTLKERVIAAERAFASYEVFIDDMMAEGDKVHVRGRFRGTHTGEFMGVPPTGRAFDVPVFVTYQVSDHKITAHWLLADTLALMQQLGIVVTPTMGRKDYPGSMSH